jgi:hypothetical protein
VQAQSLAFTASKMLSESAPEPDPVASTLIANMSAPARPTIVMRPGLRPTTTG